jgi:hypothetical protein
LKLAQIAVNQFASPKLEKKNVPLKMMTSPQAKVSELKEYKKKPNVWLKRMKYHVDH